MTLGREKLLNIGGLGAKERCLKDGIGDESTVSSSALSRVPAPTQSLPSAYPRCSGSGFFRCVFMDRSIRYSQN